MGTKPWISHSAIAKPPFETTNKKKINPDSLSTVLCDTNGAEVQQRLALSASLPASANVLYYGILLQSRVTGGNTAS